MTPNSVPGADLLPLLGSEVFLIQIVGTFYDMSKIQFDDVELFWLLGSVTVPYRFSA